MIRSYTNAFPKKYFAQCSVKKVLAEDFCRGPLLLTLIGDGIVNPALTNSTRPLRWSNSHIPQSCRAQFALAEYSAL